MKANLLQEMAVAKEGKSLIDAVDNLFLNQFLDEKELEFRITIKNKKSNLPSKELYNRIEKDNARFVFSENAIKKIATNYRLRFLDSDMYKPQIPELAFVKARRLEETYGTKFDTYKILAPEKSFDTETAKDPLIFAQIAEKKYIFIHKWGNDLSRFRKVSRWPIRTPYHFAFTVFTFLFLLTSLFAPEANPGSNSVLSPKFVFFFTGLIMAISSSVYAFLAFQKNFSCYVYNSIYNNR